MSYFVRVFDKFVRLSGGKMGAVNLSFFYTYCIFFSLTRGRRNRRHPITFYV